MEGRKGEEMSSDGTENAPTGDNDDLVSKASKEDVRKALIKVEVR